MDVHSSLLIADTGPSTVLPSAGSGRAGQAVLGVVAPNPVYYTRFSNKNQQKRAKKIVLSSHIMTKLLSEHADEWLLKVKFIYFIGQAILQLFDQRSKVKNQSAFTLTELIAVILIVGILATVAIPVMRGRMDSAKWAEGKAMAGSLATAIRAYAAEMGPSATLYGANLPTLAGLGLIAGDLTGTYFTSANYSWTTSYAVGSPLTYQITITKPASVSAPAQYTLNQAGTWGN